MKRFASYLSLVMVIALTLVFSPMAQAKSPKKAPEFSMQSVKSMTGTIAEINQAENFIILKQGKKKVLLNGALIIKVTEGARQIATLADLVKGQKAHFWVNKKAGPKKTLQGLIVTQFLGVKALASQPPVAQFSVSSSQGLESISPVVAISLSKVSTNDVKLSYTVSGTATGKGTDYTLENGDVVIAAGQTTGIIPLTVNNDSALESNETVVVTLTAVKNATLGAQKVHTYTIQDNDAVEAGVSFSLDSSTGSESATSVNFQVNLSVAATAEVKVDYTVTGTATGSGTDFTLANGTLTIPAGQTNGSIPATIVDDSLIESSETIVLTLSNARGATLGSTTVHTYTITDNDQANIGFGSASSAGAESVTAVNIPVTLSAVSTKESKVSYTITGTATGSGTDYTLANGVATIAAGQTTTNIPLTVVNDTTDEIDETVIVTLSSPVEATLGSTVVHTYTIQDDDNPTVQFTSASGNGAESVTPVSVGLTVSAAPAADVQVTYAVTGTATGGGVDYTLANGTATITAGQTSVNISLVVVDDVAVDAGETVIITISSPTNSTLGTNTVYTYTINDND